MPCNRPIASRTNCGREATRCLPGRCRQGGVDAAGQHGSVQNALRACCEALARGHAALARGHALLLISLHWTPAHVYSGGYDSRVALHVLRPRAVPHPSIRSSVAPPPPPPPGLQSRMSEVFATDIHPGARPQRGVGALQGGRTSACRRHRHRPRPRVHPSPHLTPTCPPIPPPHARRALWQGHFAGPRHRCTGGRAACPALGALPACSVLLHLARPAQQRLLNG